MMPERVIATQKGVQIGGGGGSFIAEKAYGKVQRERILEKKLDLHGKDT